MDGTDRIDDRATCHLLRKESDMNLSRSFALRLAAITFLSVCSPVYGQTASSTAQPASIAVSIAMDKDHVPIGQIPLAILTVKNLTDHEVVIHDSMYRAYVEGKEGEPPTTRAQRQMTGRLRHGEAPLRGDEMSLWTVAPGESGVRKFQLSYLYDLSTPGQYKVYAEVIDPTTRRRLRTNTVYFEMQAPAQ
jgi:hypothetical protein